MSLRIGDIAPNFVAETTHGFIDFHQWLAGRWCVLFSHPKDFTPVCTTELAEAAKCAPQFQKRNCALIGLSVDSTADHRKWITDIRMATGADVAFPMIGDPDLKVAKQYDMLPSDEGNSSKARSAKDNHTVRSVFFISPARLICAIMTYPMTSGRSFDEILRLLDSLQLTASAKVATPVNWTAQDDIIIPPSTNNEEALAKYPEGWTAPLPYLRFIKKGQLESAS